MIAFKALSIGASHKEKGKPCQDVSYCFLNADKTAGIAAVADGHGGEKYFRSSYGSKAATEIARQELWNFYKLSLPEPGKPVPLVRPQNGEEFFEKNIKRIEENIIRKWRDRVANHLKRNALTEKELATCAEIKLAIDDIQIKPENYPFIYGTTLLAALVAPDFWFAVQIGDGKTVVLDEKGKPAVPEALIIDENNDAESQAFGRTYSLCDSHAAEHFHRTFGFNKIKGLVVASDGVSDSFLPDKYLDYLSDLRNNFIEQPAAAQKGLSDFLPTLSEEGSRDDVSIAGVVR